MKVFFSFFLGFLGLWNPSASAQATDQIAALLGTKENKTAVLRNYYTDDKLMFDSTGHLDSAGTAGFGPSDGRVYVEKIKLDADRLVLTGKRTVPFYDEGSGSFKQMATKRSVRIEIGLPVGQPTADAIAPLLNSMFMQESELDQLKCSADEAKAFRDRLAMARELDDRPQPKTPEVQSLQELTQVCFPFGERAYPGGGGISPPHLIRVKGIQFRWGQHLGTGVILLIVDTKGNPTSIYIARALGHSGDEPVLAALWKAKFEPARFQGVPVPVVVALDLKGFPD